jgi:hypothetical protein
MALQTSDTLRQIYIISFHMIIAYYSKFNSS